MGPEWSVVLGEGQAGNAAAQGRHPLRLHFDSRVRLELQGAKVASDWATPWGGSLCQAVVKRWPLCSLQEKLIRLGARMVRYTCRLVFQLAAVAALGSWVLPCWSVLTSCSALLGCRGKRMAEESKRRR